MKPLSNDQSLHLCPTCRAENPPGARFCLGCGERLAAACWDCGQAVPAGARFCIHCGARQQPAGDAANAQGASESLTAALQQIARLQVAAAPRPAASTIAHERRLVTLLFCDVQSYSTLASQLDPEEVVELMNGAYACMIEPVFRCQGSIIHNLGDAILACFGAPAAREDDPERAVRAGLEITASIRQYAARLAAERGLQAFDVRVGINTGLVVIGEMGSDQWAEFTALGDAVNLAARMQQHAPAGGVLISHDTYRHVRGLFDLVPQAPLAVKGRQEPVQTYLVHAARPPAWRIKNRGVEGVQTHLVGRESELGCLQGAYRQVVGGPQAKLVLVTGEPGIGKSRLLDELDLWCETQPERIAYFRGRATETSQATPYSVFRDLFANRCGILESDPPAQALAKFRRGLLGCLDEDSADQVGQLVGFDFTASRAVASLISSPSFAPLASAYLVHYFRRVASQPLVILLDDLHWSDDASLDLLLRLMDELREAPLLVVAAARRRLLDRRPDLEQGKPAVERLELQPLALNGCQALVGEILQQVESLPPLLVNTIAQRMEGNPFYAEELVQALIDDGVIERRQPHWQVDLTRLAQIQIPPTLTGLLQARLDGLPAEEKLLLQRASIAGKIFWDALLAWLTGDPAEMTRIAPCLDSLQQRGLIFQRQPSVFAGIEEYAFKQNMLREVTYEMVLLRQRRGYHARVAAWLEQQAGGRLDEYLGLVARHYELAGLKDAAGGWYLRAGERARQQGGLHEARHFLDRALVLLPEADLEGRWRALAARDSILGGLGEIEARRRDSQALLALAGQMGDERRLAEAWYHLGSAAETQGDLKQAVKGFDASLEIAGRVGDQKLVAEVLPMKLLCLTRLSRTAEGAEIAEAALQTAMTLGDPLVLTKALNNVSIYYDAVGDLARAAELLGQGVAINSQVGDRMGEVLGLNNLGYTYLQLGLYQPGWDSLLKSLEVAQSIGARRVCSYTRLNLALACWRTGQLEQAAHELALSGVDFEQIGDAFGTVCVKAYRGLVSEAASDPVGAESAYQAAFDEFTSLAMPGLAADAAAGLARVACTAGKLEQAGLFAGQAWQYIEEHGLQAMEFPLLACQTLVETFTALGQAVLSRRVLELGHAELQARAARISSPAWRLSFLENVPENRVLGEMWVKE